MFPVAEGDQDPAPSSSSIGTSLSSQSAVQNVQIPGLQTPMVSTTLLNDINSDGNNVTVQHYLLTNIITNTSTGKQTSQLITQPVLMPETNQSNQKPDQNLVLVPSLNIPLEIVPDSYQINLVPQNTPDSGNVNQHSTLDPTSASQQSSSNSDSTLTSQELLGTTPIGVVPNSSGDEMIQLSNNYTPLEALAPASSFISNVSNPLIYVKSGSPCTSTETSQTALFTDSTLAPQDYINFSGIQNNVADVSSRNASNDLLTQSTLDANTVQELKFLPENSQDGKFSSMLLNDFFTPSEINSNFNDSNSLLISSLKGQKDKNKDLVGMDDDMFLSEAVSKELSDALNESTEVMNL